ncbi:MAG: helix-turn-helix domain-containing protein [Sulfuricella sp.]
MIETTLALPVYRAPPLHAKAPYRAVEKTALPRPESSCPPTTATTGDKPRFIGFFDSETVAPCCSSVARVVRGGFDKNNWVDCYSILEKSIVNSVLKQGDIMEPSQFHWIGIMASSEKAFFVALGKRVAELRHAQGLTQQQLAEQLGVAQQTLAHYEGAKARVPASMLPQLAQFLLCR